MNIIGCGCQLCYERNKMKKPRCETAPDPETGLDLDLLKRRLAYAFDKLRYTIDEEKQDPESADEAKGAIRLALEQLNAAPPSWSGAVIEEHKVKAEDTPS